MKIAIASLGRTFDAKVDSRFGRCEYFALFTVQDKKIVKSVLQGKNCSNCIFFTNSYASLNKKYCIIHYKNIKNPNSIVCDYFSENDNE